MRVSLRLTRSEIRVRLRSSCLGSFCIHPILSLPIAGLCTASQRRLSRTLTIASVRGPSNGVVGRSREKRPAVRPVVHEHGRAHAREEESAAGRELARGQLAATCGRRFRLDLDRGLRLAAAVSPTAASAKAGRFFSPCGWCGSMRTVVGSSSGEIRDVTTLAYALGRVAGVGRS